MKHALVLVFGALTLGSLGCHANESIDASTLADAPSGVDAGRDVAGDAWSVDAFSADDAFATVDAFATHDAGSAGCTVFAGAYQAVEIRCDGVPYTRMASLVPPAGSWTINDTDAVDTFTQRVGTCGLVAAGHIACDAPIAGQFTHTPSAPLACDPAGCLPFATACGAGGSGSTATWTYERRADGTVRTTTVGATPVATCTAAGQSNPVEVIWAPM